MHFERNERGFLVPEKMRFTGRYEGRIIRAGRVVDEFVDENLVVNQGLNSLLSVYFNSGTQLPNWYLGIFQGNYTPVASDTAAGVAAATTECSSYTNATRPQWVPAAPASQAITNSASPATYTFNAGVTIYGAFMISNNVIGGTGGTLFSEALFASPKTVANADQLLLTYTFTASSS